MSFWRSLFGDWRISLLKNKKIPRRSKNFSVGMTLRFLLSSEWHFATVILMEIFGDWRILSIENIKIPCWNKNKIPRRSKKTSLSEWHWDSSYRQNDISLLSFWRRFSATEESLHIENIKIPCWNKNKIPRRSKKTSLLEWQTDSSSKRKIFSVGMTRRFLLSSEWKYTALNPNTN